MGDLGVKRGVLEEKMLDFLVKSGIFEQTMCDFWGNGDFLERKCMIFGIMGYFWRENA